MQVLVNGTKYNFPDNISIAQMLTHLNVDTRKVAIEHNLSIISGSLYSHTTLNEGDVCEIVQFIGGG